MEAVRHMIAHQPVRRARWEWLKPHYTGGVPQRRQLKRLLTDVGLFSRHVIGTPLRPYQLAPARAILHSVLHRQGLTYTIMMSRQAGKNELSAQLEAFLLIRFQRTPATIVKAAPSFRPQIVNSLLRLERCLDNPLSHGRWTRRLGNIQLRHARVRFFSGAPESHVVGATASLLLEIDEAQDFDEDKYLKDFRPMGASTNATTVLYGTAWTSDTLLEHVRLENRRLEAIDGIQRNFTYPWAAVAEHNADYRTFVQAEALRMGADHPLFRTQYLLEPLTSAGRLFSETQLSQMEAPLAHPEPVEGPEPIEGPSAHPEPVEGPEPIEGPSAHPEPLEGPARPAPVPPGAVVLPTERQPTQSAHPEPVEGPGPSLSSPSPSGRGQGEGGVSPEFPLTSRTTSPIVVAGIDLAGEDEEAEDAILRALEPQRDSTAVAIAQVTWETTLGVTEPRIHVLHLYSWTGRKHRELLPQLIDLLRNVWRCQSVTVDATGVGAGIASFLVGALGAHVAHPFTFSAVSKSDLGYQLLSAVNSGRLKIPPLLPQRGRLGEGNPGPPPEEISFTPSPAHGGGGWGEAAAALTEFWRQAHLARSTLHANQRLSWYVDPREGHDDLLVSVALAVEAAQHSRPRLAIGRVAKR